MYIYKYKMSQEILIRLVSNRQNSCKIIYNVYEKINFQNNSYYNHRIITYKLRLIK